jgi:hypothetical protein
MTFSDEKIGKAIPERISVAHDYQVAYWATIFGVTTEQLLAAVRKVGFNVTDVKDELRKGMD